MKKTLNKKSARRKRKVMSPEERLRKKEQRDQMKEIRDIMFRIGFTRLSGIDGKEFVYDGRTSELDDIFICKNVILLTEYTIGDPHILKKKIIYDKINSDIHAFVKYLIDNKIFDSFNDIYKNSISNKYTVNQMRVKVLYCSKKSISQEHKDNVLNVIYFDYHIVKYFKSLTGVVKLSARYEFMDFLGIKENEWGDNILNSSVGTTSCFSGHILPEERSSFKEGYKIISFYIDAESLLKRAYVLRQEGWRKKENVGYYQRMLDAKKIVSMRRYLSSERRVFINNIITTISENDIRMYKDQNRREEIVIDENGNFVGDNKRTNVTPAYVEILNKCNIIGIIDGQHRTFAYHEGNDVYEESIKRLRKIQNLLVTGIIFPKTESKENRLKFEAGLFLEINSNQKKVGQLIQQEIQMQIKPFSNIAVSKRILNMLNEHGALANMIELYTYEKGKIKTASVVSFGLKPLIKFDLDKNDSFYSIWNHENKKELLEANCQNYALLDEYIKFCVKEINEVMSAFKSCLKSYEWKPYCAKASSGVLTVTFINGVLNLIRLLIENNQLNGIDSYRDKLKSIDGFNIKQYKSSQYRRMGEDIYNKYFTTK